VKKKAIKYRTSGFFTKDILINKIVIEVVSPMRARLPKNILFQTCDTEILLTSRTIIVAIKLCPMFTSRNNRGSRFKPKSVASFALT
jgi:hypothetical protein